MEGVSGIGDLVLAALAWRELRCVLTKHAEHQPCRGVVSSPAAALIIQLGTVRLGRHASGALYVWGTVRLATGMVRV